MLYRFLIIIFLPLALFSSEVVLKNSGTIKGWDYIEYKVKLNGEDYSELFEVDCETIKNLFLDNHMIYIGTITDSKFMVNNTDINKADKLVILARGV